MAVDSKVEILRGATGLNKPARYEAKDQSTTLPTCLVHFVLSSHPPYQVLSYSSHRAP